MDKKCVKICLATELTNAQLFDKIKPLQGVQDRIKHIYFIAEAIGSYKVIALCRSIKSEIEYATANGTAVKFSELEHGF